MADIEQSGYVQQPLSGLIPWSKNPRRSTAEQVKKLEKKIRKLGVYKPLITVGEDSVLQAGIILGGNRRYEVFNMLKLDKVWCSIVNPKTEAEALEIAISDNENDGEWIEEQLAELIYNQPIELDLYSVHLSRPISLSKLLEQESANGPKVNTEWSCPECGHVNTPSAFKTAGRQQ